MDRPIGEVNGAAAAELIGRIAGGRRLRQRRSGCQLVMYLATVMCPRLLGATQRRPYLEPEPFRLIADNRVLVATWRELKPCAENPEPAENERTSASRSLGTVGGQDMRRLASVYCGNVDPVRDRPASPRSLSKSNLRGAA